MSIGSNAATVVFDNVSKKFGETTAVRDISFSIDPGQMVTLLGPSGCGKTTTLRLIAGLELVTSGQIHIGGTDVTRLPATDRDVTMVFQSYALFPHMSVAQNVAYGLRVGGLPEADAREAAEAGLNLVGLGGYGERLPSELSGGQQQRVAVARALVLEPQVLLFDEPLSNLDARLRRQVREEIRELQQSLGVTAVYVTHDQQEALAVSDRIIVMNDAVIAQNGTPRDIYERPVNRFVANFIGDANLIAVELEHHQPSQAVVRLGDVQLTLPWEGGANNQPLLAVRPEAIVVNPADQNQTGLPGTVRKAVYLGNQIEYHIDTGYGEIFVVESDIRRLLATGSPVYLDFSPHGLSLVAS